MRQNDEKKIEIYTEFVTTIRNFQTLARLTERDVINFLLNYIGNEIPTSDEEEVRDFVREIYTLFIRIKAGKCKR